MGKKVKLQSQVNKAKKGLPRKKKAKHALAGRKMGLVNGRVAATRAANIKAGTPHKGVLATTRKQKATKAKLAIQKGKTKIKKVGVKVGKKALEEYVKAEASGDVVGYFGDKALGYVDEGVAYVADVAEEALGGIVSGAQKVEETANEVHSLYNLFGRITDFLV